MSLPFNTPSASVYLNDEGFVTLTSSCDVIVQYDGKYIARVTTPAEMRHSLHGLCGNCDGNAENDVEVNGKAFFKFRSIEDGFRALAHHYLVHDDSDIPSNETK